jgi:hypothetical protein
VRSKRPQSEAERITSGFDMTAPRVARLSPGGGLEFFGKNYRHAESKIVACKGYFKTNPTAWVSMLDVFNDLLVDDLFRRDGTVGARNLGNFGGVIGNKAFMTKFPKTSAYVSAVHTKRGEGELAHPIVKATKAPTGRIPFKWLKTGRKLMTAALAEIKAAGY